MSVCITTGFLAVAPLITHGKYARFRSVWIMSSRRLSPNFTFILKHIRGDDSSFLCMSFALVVCVSQARGFRCGPACRQIAGFPKIDANNDYFLARFDGALIDGQSWGRGQNTLSMKQAIDMGSNPHSSSRQASLAELYQKEVCLQTYTDTPQPQPGTTPLCRPPLQF